MKGASLSLRAILELLSFASSIVVAIAALFALRQLRIAKDAINQAKMDLQTRSKREAVQLAAEQCESFAGTLLPRMNTELTKLSTAGLSNEPWQLVDNGFEAASVKDGAKGLAWVQRLRMNAAALAAATNALNDLEAFAMWFAKGAADEETAFSSVGTVFRNYVERLAPLLVALRHQQFAGQPSGPFQNTVDLYTLWDMRAKNNELEIAAAKLKQQQKGKPTQIKPIGT